jgi:hypothetical protein
MKPVRQALFDLCKSDAFFFFDLIQINHSPNMHQYNHSMCFLA